MTSRDGQPPLRIAYYVSTIAYGGLERNVLQMLSLLDRAQHAPSIFLRCTDAAGDRALRRELHALQVPVHELGDDALPVVRRSPSTPQAPKRPGRLRNSLLACTPSGIKWAWYAWRRIAETAAVFRAMSIDALHVCHGAYPNLELPVIAGWVAGIPCRISSVQSFPRVAPPASRLRRALIRWATRCPTHVVAQGERIRQELARAHGVPRRRLRVIANGIDPAELASPPGAGLAVRQRLGIAPGARVVTTSARLSAEKGHRVLLDAAARIKARHPDVVYLVAGDGPLRTVLEAQARALGLERMVRFLGFSDEMPALLAASDVAALPSLNEGMPAAVLEAMAAGVPVVASDAGATGELFSHEPVGVLVPPGDAGALAAALEHVLGASAPQRRAWGEAGRRVVQARYSCRQAFESTLALYADARSSAARQKAVQVG